jgi:zinc D-Ala-D-Ala carboxypeptidase
VFRSAGTVPQRKALHCLGALALASACQKDPPTLQATPSSSATSAAKTAEDAAAETGFDAAQTDPTLSTASTAGAAEHAFVGTTAKGRACSFAVKRPGTLGGEIAKEDTEMAFANGDDLLALVNRSPLGSLDPAYAPSDLVSAISLKPESAESCEAKLCLRKDAATALGELLQEMSKQGVPGHLESAFRSYLSQCVTFDRWTKRSSFCAATEQSALPGHSQHQLGTAVDLFTAQWKQDGNGDGVFRNGFGCSPGGTFLREKAYQYGFVISYPIDPADAAPKHPCEVRSDVPSGINAWTGYRPESWHLRYIGKAHAAAYFAEHQASGGSVTLEQWIRKNQGLPGPITLPVCDGCNCGACSTLASKGPCQDAVRYTLDATGKASPAQSSRAPKLEKVAPAQRRKGGRASIGLDVVSEGAALTYAGSELDVAAEGLEVFRLEIALDPGEAKDVAGTKLILPFERSGTTPLGYRRAKIALPAASGRYTIVTDLEEGSAPASVKVAKLERGKGWTELQSLALRVDPLSLSRAISRRVAP